jgi:hypothetical protein
MAAALLMGSPVSADQPVETAVMNGNILTNVAGVLAVNQTAGNGNVQSNVAAIGKAGAPLVQQSTAAAASQTGRSSIGDFAFSGATGILQVNQSAGSGNAQANVVYVTDSTLSAAIPQQNAPPGTAASNGANAISVSKTAFANAKGLVQVSQIAGTSNRTANTFVLQLPSVAGH